MTSLYDEEEGWRPTHIRLADEADLLLVAPVTGNTIAKLANGLADDALGCIALALSAEVPVVIAPALNGKMWDHPATQQNVKTLVERGVKIVGPAEGDLACGYEGLGRLAPVEEIVSASLQSIGLDG